MHICSLQSCAKLECNTSFVKMCACMHAVLQHWPSEFLQEDDLPEYVQVFQVTLVCIYSTNCRHALLSLMQYIRPHTMHPCSLSVSELFLQPHWCRSLARAMRTWTCNVQDQRRLHRAMTHLVHRALAAAFKGWAHVTAIQTAQRAHISANLIKVQHRCVCMSSNRNSPGSSLSPSTSQYILDLHSMIQQSK